MICRFILNFHSCFGLIFAKNMLLCLDFDSLECLMIYSFQKKHLVSYTMTTVAHQFFSDHFNRYQVLLLR